MITQDQELSDRSRAPRGDRLTPRLIKEDSRQPWIERARLLPSLQLSSREIADVECLAVGAFSPLEGFLGRDDYESVVESMRLSSGDIWSLPVTLSVTADESSALKGAQDVLLNGPGNVPLAIIHVDEIFRRDPEREAKLVYGTTDKAHPGVATLQTQGELLVGGKVSVLQLPFPAYSSHQLTPEETRDEIATRGWRTVAGFQTRNPIHRAHEYLTKCALEVCDGLLLHPLVGETKPGDVPSEVRMKAYQALLEDYYPSTRALLSVFPAAMRYAGPREAVFHAICRKNYGCTHFIVGRDHAGVGNYYGSYDAHRIFDQFDPEEIGITPLFFDHAFYCRRCDQTATEKTCPHSEDERVSLSGTEVRRRLAEDLEIPQEFTRPEIAEILRDWARSEVSRL